ncbi:MAG: PD40 domain-containing protein [Planctomycetes bacterium]|nr:PD40 domain-containing protein [Planctomycetota bacterium]
MWSDGTRFYFTSSKPCNSRGYHRIVTYIRPRWSPAGKLEEP